MIVDTKYNVGDICFILHNYSIIKCKILGIHIDKVFGVYQNYSTINPVVSKNNIFYYLTNEKGATFLRDEEHVFKTKQELFEFLNK